MDLFDLGCFFAYYVPAKALVNPLLKYAAVAYAAKQLGRVTGAKAIVGGIVSQKACMEVYPDIEKVNWLYKGAQYYDKAISLLVEEIKLQDERQGVVMGASDVLTHWRSPGSKEDADEGNRKRRRLSCSGPALVRSDELLAATAILCVYEFLDASGAAWSRHLSGTKSLLDIAETGMMPFQSTTGSSLLARQRLGISKARKAIFWNFARQDMLAACKEHSLA